MPIAPALALLVSLAYPPPLSPWMMTLSVADSGVVKVGACFPELDLSGVRVSTVRGQRAVRSVEASANAGSPVPLQPRPDGIWIVPEGSAECFTVTYDRAALSRPPMSLDWSFDPRDVLFSPVGIEARSAHVRLEPTPGRRLWVPWPAVGPDTYHAPESAFRLPGHAFIGPSFASRAFAASGTKVDLTVAHGFTTLDLDGAERWLRRSLVLHAGLFVDFPCPAWSLVVVPAPAGTTGRGSPVVFGTTSRGGGPHIVAWLPADIRAEALPGEWVLIHELFHLAQPWIEDDWFAEGLATYYGEVLRARGGVLTPVQLWAGLLDGFRRGASVGGTLPLGREEDEMTTRRTYWRVYWGGAAIALLADVDLRSRKAGNLDDGVRALSSRLGLTDANSAMAAMADATGDDAFRALAKVALASTAFPDVAGTLAALGVRDGPDGVTLDDAAPLAAIRRAIETGLPITVPPPSRR